MTQIDGKFLVHGNETVGSVENFLRESDRVFILIDFFDVTSPSTDATHEVAEHICARRRATLAKL